MNVYANATQGQRRLEMAKDKATVADEDYVDQIVRGIDQRIQRINKKLAPFDELIEKRNKLQAARRALLSERAPTAGGGRGTTQEEVVDALRKLGSATVHQLAQQLGATEGAVRGHLNRGKDERFTRKENMEWVLREPEKDEPEDDDEDED
jgi:CHASE3 domain sensor protein